MAAAGASSDSGRKPVSAVQYERLQAKWAGTGIFGQVLVQALAAQSSGGTPTTAGCHPDEAAQSAVMTVPPPSFTKLISRDLHFVDRINKNAIVYSLDDTGLVLRVNKVFVKRVLILRIHARTSVVLDQDDWPIAVPSHQFSRIQQRLGALACSAGVPIFTVVHCDVDPAAFTHTAATRDLTSVTLEMLGGTGTLQVSWSRVSTKLVEELTLWPATGVTSDGASILASAFLCSHAVADLFLDQSTDQPLELKLAMKQLRDAAVWAASRAADAFLIVDTGSIEGQAIASVVWPQLRECHRAAILLVSPPPMDGTVMVGHGGAAAGYSTAFTLHQILGNESDDVAPVAFVDASVWPVASQMLLPVLREQLAQDQARAGRILSIPQVALSHTHSFLTSIQTAYCSSRPYIHSFSGAGVQEAEISEAIEGATGRVHHLEELIVALPPPAHIARIESALPKLKSNAGKPLLNQKGQQLRKTLLPIGNAACLLARMVEEHLGSLWCVESSGWQQNCLVVMDFTDPKALTWLKAAEKEAHRRTQSGEGLWCGHMIALVPACRAPHASWETAAEPLAMVMSGDVLELGLGIVVSVDSNQECWLALMEALASVRLHDVAFQLRPRPRVSLGFVAYHALDDHTLLTLTGDIISSGDVLASFSLWPSGRMPDDEANSSRCNGLLLAHFLEPTLPPDIARGGVFYENSLQPVCPGAGGWHLCTCESMEASLYRRAAGDFDGRENGEFKWQGSDDGPQAQLWELAAEISRSSARDDEDAAEAEELGDSSLDGHEHPASLLPRASPCTSTPRSQEDVAEASGSYDDSGFCSEDSM
jgi:hypothetical protein